MKSSDELLKIAQIGKSVGLRGFLKLHLHTDFPEQFKKNSLFYLSNKEELVIEEYNRQRGIVKFAGFNDKESASALTNQFLYTTFKQSQENCSLSEGEFFWFDLMDALVLENETLLGKVTDIQRFDPNDFLIVQTDQKLLDMSLPKQFLIPYIERFIIKFDKENKTVYTKDALELLKNS